MPQPIFVAHHIPGRIRLKIPNAAPGLLDQIRNRLLGVAGIHSVETNPLTGSVLILYSPGERKDFVNVLAERLREHVAFSASPKHEVGDYSTTATSIVALVKQADDGLRSGSSGMVDLKLLFPLSMLALAALTLPTTLQTPLWLTFAMFSFSSFESMHTGALEQPAGKSGEEHESNAASGAGQG